MLRNRLAKERLPKDFSKWIAENESGMVGVEEEKVFQQNTADISFLVLYHINESSTETVSTVIRSMQAQIAPGWNLHIIIHEFSENFGQDKRERLQETDNRVTIWDFGKESVERKNFLEEIKTSEFDFAIFIEQSSILRHCALNEIIKLVDSEPDALFIYTDVDQINSDGGRHSPWFKPDWSPELLLSINYLKPAIIRFEALNKIDNFWIDFLEGNHWNSLLDQAVKYENGIFHLPKILSHRQSNTDPWLYRPQPQREHEEWVVHHLESRAVHAPKIERQDTDQIRVTWSISLPLVSIIIPTRENLNLIRKCLESLLGLTKYKNIEVLLIDTGSRSEGVWQFYNEHKADHRIRLLTFDEPFNYSRVNNFGVENSTGEVLLFLNNDIEIIDPDWLHEMARWAERPEIGLVGAKLIYPDHSIQHAGVILGLGGHAGHIFLGAQEHETGPFGSADWYRNFSAVTGACMLMRREVYEKVGGFDEEYELVFSDVDLCTRVVEMGYRIMVTPYARLIHKAGSTRQRFNPRSDLVRAFESFHPYLENGDPFYNPNLSYADPYPRLISGKEESTIERVRRIVEG